MPKVRMCEDCGEKEVNSDNKELHGRYICHTCGCAEDTKHQILRKFEPVFEEYDKLMDEVSLMTGFVNDTKIYKGTLENFFLFLNYNGENEEVKKRMIANDLVNYQF